MPADSAGGGTPLWSLDGAPPDYVLTGVRAVLPDRVLDDARVVVRGGLIAEVAPRRGVRGDVDGGGLLVVPGLVDVHSDALERERAPRPTAVLPWDFAIASFEGRLVGAGVTTAFHGAGFQHEHARGVRREPEAALELARAVDDARVVDTGRVGCSGRLDHRVLHRLDVTSAPGQAALRERLASLPVAPDLAGATTAGTTTAGATTAGATAAGTAGDPPPLVSHEDHTPGQGQYADPEQLVRYIVGEDGLTPDDARQRVAALQATRAGAHVERDGALAWLGDLARAGRIRLMGHDPDTVEAVEALEARGAVAAEFPTTLVAAREARARGLLVVAGAPNALRGASHSGNVSAAQLLAEGLVDALASDYLPSALLGAVARIVRDRTCDLPAAVHLVTAGPAAVAGFTDRGALRPGLRADLALVEDRRGPWPQVIATLTACLSPPTESSRG